jgi:hypothetical protein
MARHQKQTPDTAMLLEIVKVLQNEARYAVAARQIDAIERKYLATA